MVKLSPKIRPYEVFISFKKTDHRTGEVTRDSTIARALFEALSDRGISAFFSEESIELLGTSEYYDLINQALDQAKVFVLVCSDPEYLQEPQGGWVRHEIKLFAQEILSRHKVDGVMFTLLAGITVSALPIEMRHVQSFDYDGQGLDHLLRFVSNRLPSSTRMVSTQSIKQADHNSDSNDAEDKIIQNLKALAHLSNDLQKTQEIYQMIDETAHSVTEAVSNMSNTWSLLKQGFQDSMDKLNLDHKRTPNSKVVDQETQNNVKNSDQDSHDSAVKSVRKSVLKSWFK